MNLVEALDAALPELPARRSRQGTPKLDPTVIAGEHIEDGVPTFNVHIPGSTSLYHFSPEQWTLANLFDGKRSYQEIASQFQAQTGVPCTEDDVREFADDLEAADFWYKTLQDKNVSFSRMLEEHRRQHSRRRWKLGDVSHIQFSAWDPDAFLTKIYPKLKFVYSRWFTLLTLLLFSFMIFVFVEHWGEIGRDTLQYYTFTQKGIGDLVEFWLLFFVLAFFHESAHGLTCKHYGGNVRHMGLHLLYLAPAFFVDVTELWVYAGRKQRLVTIMAGIWVEMIVCSLATVVWWGTASGAGAHDFAYKVMLITGVAVVVVNLNPLIKLDGYYAFSEIIGIGDIKEKSTAFVSSWVKRHLFRLPTQVDYVPRRRRWLYSIYAVLSGAYSYGLLLAVVRFAYNVFSNLTPEWAFLPAAGLAWLIFKSRIRTLGRFMNTVYLDKKERLRAWLTGPRAVGVAVVLAIAAFAPIWPEWVQARFILEPVQRSVVRAEVPGTVAEVFVDEGQRVTAGAPVANLRNLQLESDAARAEADFRVASARVTQAQLQYAGLGQAERERERLAEQRRMLSEQVAKLQLYSPISGVAVTARVHELAGSYVRPGREIVEIADLSTLWARAYLPEFALRYVHPGARVRLHFDSAFRSMPGRIDSIAPASSEIEAGLTGEQKYKGIAAPGYYVALVMVPNPNMALNDGLTGTAKIFVRYRSVTEFVWRELRDFISRKLW